MSELKYKIIEGSVEWAPRYAEFCRQAYRANYPRPELGITKDLFSKGVFGSARIVNYFGEICENTKDKKTWLCVDQDHSLLGVVAAQRYPDYCQMMSFYVKPELKGQGIGHALYQKVLEFAADREILVDVVEYMQDTIDMYEHWGFHIDESKGVLIYNLEEWPEKARQAYRAIYMVKPATNK